jgi:two-component system NtrC family sensor kinase
MIADHDLQSRISELEQQLADAVAHAAAMEQKAGLLQERATAASERLNAILSTSAALLMSRDVDTVVDLVVNEALRLFGGTSGVQLFLTDETGERLVLKSVQGNGRELKTERSCRGLADMGFMAPRALLLAGPEIEVALKDLGEEQLRLLRESLSEWPPLSALLAPLRVEEQRLGVLVLYGGVNAHLYHPRDLPYVQTLADLTAIAIDEINQRTRAAALQRDLAASRLLHAETKARLDTAQAQLLQSAKLAAVGELSASVAHEINNPLYAARNSLYLVEQDLTEDSPQRPFLSIAQQELGRIARIITRMRDFYRPTRAELGLIGINTLLRETLELVQTHLRHGHITAIATLDPHLPQMTAHADQLRQVFLNIILNACDAMPHGGELRVTTEMIQARSEAPPTIGVYINDTGIGIPPEHREHLFEPFYTTKPQGTGLGLAISAHIITQHSGRISVESAAGQGTTFTILLPVVE